MSQFTHLDDQGAARMVDIGSKVVTERIAAAAARVSMQNETLTLLQSEANPKGDVLAVARVAGIQAAKKCADLIPLCHPLMLSSVTVDFEVDHTTACINIMATCKVSGMTGVEMEALTAASVAALTIYDMCKAIDKGMQIDAVRLLSKDGGKSGSWQREQGAG